MAVRAEVAEAEADSPRYARFSRRLRGIAIDFMLFVIAMVTALQISIALNSDDLARVIGFGFIAGFLLYEPLLVSLTGGTVGHYLSNLRVVDDRSNRNVSFPKAVARMAIKAVLGWYSFISMAAARRHQAVHDLLTRSTVQIRDSAKALPHHYIREQVEPSGPGMPSRWRRIVVIVGYVIASYAAVAIVVGVLYAAGAISRPCMDDFDRCSTGEGLMLAAFGLAWIVAIALLVGRGWRGRLWGARRHAEVV